MARLRTSCVPERMFFLSEAATLGGISPGLCLSASGSIFDYICLLDIPTKLNRMNRHFGINVLWAKARGAIFLK